MCCLTNQPSEDLQVSGYWSSQFQDNFELYNVWKRKGGWLLFNKVLLSGDRINVTSCFCNWMSSFQDAAVSIDVYHKKGSKKNFYNTQAWRWLPVFSSVRITSSQRRCLRFRTAKIRAVWWSAKGAEPLNNSMESCRSVKKLVETENS